MADSVAPDYARSETERRLALEKRVRALEAPDGTQTARAVERLQELVATQQSTIDELAAQQATLIAQQAALTAAQDDLEELVLGQISTAVLTDSDSDFSIGSGYSTKASVTFTVPTGYTKALIFAAGALSACSSSDGDRLYVKIAIDGSDGPASTTVLPTGAPFGATAATYARNITGLTAGATVQASILTKLYIGPTESLLEGWNTANISAQAIFLR